VHSFWLSPEEKWTWLKLSMKGQPWLSSSSMAGHGELARGKGEGEEKGRRLAVEE
jgi:hypothetical protein